MLKTIEMEKMEKIYKKKKIEKQKHSKTSSIDYIYEYTTTYKYKNI